MIIEGNCNFPHNSGTAGPIWINFFLLAPSWSQGGFRPKNPDPGFGFSGNPEKPGFLGIIIIG